MCLITAALPQRSSTHAAGVNELLQRRAVRCGENDATCYGAVRPRAPHCNNVAIAGVNTP